MKKLILFFAVAAVAMTGCNAETVTITTDYKIVNRLNSDIVVELNKGDIQVITIKPGEEHVVYQHIYDHEKGSRPEFSMSEKIMETSEPKMDINEKAMPELIWMRNNWDYKSSDVSNPTYLFITYSLIVTDELIERISLDDKNNQ